MFEVGGVLQTYRLGRPPGKLLLGRSSAVKIFDHPLKFLTYEGSVNQGTGRVQITDAGTYRLLSEGNDFRELQLNGKMLKGKFILTHIEGDKWQFSLS
jgi:hypothetical protein